MMTNFNADFLKEDELASLPFAKIGSRVLIDRTVSIVNLERLTIGDNVRIDAHTILVASGGIEIGSHVHISANCYLAGGGGIRIHDFANLSSDVKLHSISDDYSGRTLTNATVPETFKDLTRAFIEVGRHAIIGSGAVVLPGVLVGEGAAIGALTLVSRSVEAWGIYAGNPARRLKDRSREILVLEGRYLDSLEGHSMDRP
jgi:acetyltransferase-like isoleucine patch superfamily enzyme